MNGARTGEQADDAVDDYKASHVNPDQSDASEALYGTTNYNGEPCAPLNAGSQACAPVAQAGAGSLLLKLLPRAGLAASGATVGAQGLKALARVRQNALPQAANGAKGVVTTGQRHHVISTRIGRVIERHPTLAGKYSRRDPRLTTQATNESAHRGYQGWHRDLDEQVVRWLGQNRNVSPKAFEQYLRGRYKQPDLRQRFPNGF